MKRRVIMALAACAVAAVFASCDSKLCYCYESTAQGVYEQEVYTNSDTPCNAMSNSSRGCVESHERMNPGDIAYK
ncbi:MAG: hypothetical protein IKR33_04375 [Bacteroidales bacterium]|nr:hypothetical protein [Bacteroidales bacterium]